MRQVSNPEVALRLHTDARSSWSRIGSISNADRVTCLSISTQRGPCKLDEKKALLRKVLASKEELIHLADDDMRQI